MEIWIPGILAAGLLGVPPTARTDSLSHAVETCMESEVRGGFSGAVLYQPGSRDSLPVEPVERDFGFDTERAFWIASLSKQFTATAILALEESGRLSLEDSLPKYFADVPADKRSITLRHLLTHTSGLGQKYAADGIADRDAAARALLSPPLEQPVGKAFRYSNDNYTLLAMVVEIASGRSFESYLRETLLAPAGLAHTGFWGEEPSAPVPLAPPADSARTAAMSPDVIRGLQGVPNWGFRGATGMWSTARDLRRWVLALPRVLRNPDRLWTPVVLVKADPAGDIYYGYGWFVTRKDGRTIEIRHGGNESELGHNGLVRRFPDGSMLIVLTNAGDREEVGASTLAGRALGRCLGF